MNLTSPFISIPNHSLRLHALHPAARFGQKLDPALMSIVGEVFMQGLTRKTVTPIIKALNEQLALNKSTQQFKELPVLDQVILKNRESSRTRKNKKPVKADAYLFHLIMRVTTKAEKTELQTAIQQLNQQAFQRSWKGRLLRWVSPRRYQDQSQLKNFSNDTLYETYHFRFQRKA